MNRIVYALLAACCVALPTAAAQAARPQPFQLEDLRKIVSLSEPAISPDGKEIAVIVSRPDWANDDSNDTIDLVDVATGAVRSLTYERTGVDSPQWAPDGTRLAFIADAQAPDSDDPDDKVSQVFVMPMDGGDPVRITQAKEGVDEYAWSPDGRRIAYVAEDSAPEKKGADKYDDAFRVTDNNYTTRTPVLPFHLWVVSAEGGDATRLTQGDWSLDTDQGTAAPIAWSRDGKTIAFTAFPDTWYGNAYRSTIASVDVASGNVKTLVSDPGAAVMSYAPNGAQFAFMRSRNGDQNNGVAVYVDDGGHTYDPTATLARNIDDYAWLPDGGGLLLSGENGTDAVIWRQPLHGDAEQLDLGGVNVGSQLSVSKKGGTVAFVGDTARHPDELYVLASLDGAPHRLTSYNAFADGIALGRVAPIEWQGPDNFREDGVLTYPVGFRHGKRYPLVLVIHGGPESATIATFDPLAQILAGKGFLVFRPNYRGSTNLGDAYQHAIYRDTGEGPGKDVMAGIEAVKKLGIVDESRIGISGWSYGGYMTSWLNGRYPQAWKAAVEGAALNDWVMDYTIAFYQKGDLYFFGGSPWTSGYWDIWRDQSPIQYARNVKAPTLIMGDVGDPNVPIVNSYEMYHALRDNGVTTEFFAYPADSHFPHDIVRTTDVYRRWVDWMVKYLAPSSQG